LKLIAPHYNDYVLLSKGEFNGQCN
jgi:hypothetical protein